MRQDGPLLWWRPKAKTRGVKVPARRVGPFARIARALISIPPLRFAAPKSRRCLLGPVIPAALSLALPAVSEASPRKPLG